jgi:hypothetical protein
MDSMRKKAGRGIAVGVFEALAVLVVIDVMAVCSEEIDGGAEDDQGGGHAA